MPRSVPPERARRQPWTRPERPRRLPRGAAAVGGRGRRRRLTPIPAAAAALTLFALLCYVVFGGRMPWAASPFILRATFTANTQLHIPSPVRVAGVDVGEVTQVTPIPGSPSAATVTMTLDPAALPVHQGATATIRARTFLEGNFYVALTQGLPGAPVLGSGSTLPAADTAGPVQLDRILSSLDSPARRNLQQLLQGVAGALAGGGARALNASLAVSTAALRASAQVNQALLGQSPHDLSGSIGGLARIFTTLAATQQRLGSLVAGFDATMTTLAGRQGALAATIGALPGTLDAARRADGALAPALPALGRVSVGLEPGLRQLPPTIRATLPWLGSLTELVDARHLGGLLGTLTPALGHTATLTGSARGLLGQLDALALCSSHDLVPTGNQVIRDPGAGSGSVPLYLELFQSAVGLTSASQNFDGNGRYLRAAIGGGGTLVQTRALPVNGPLFGNAVLPPLGTRPLLPSVAPPVVTTAPCARAAAPDLNAVSTGGTP
ncbi:MAG TPA: MlaD family protein [Solirubrobacteraceae bacterium]|nr:MlaD family protein [Solirubrobacteraceae bacterium]